MTVQLDRKVHDSNTCPTLKYKKYIQLVKRLDQTPEMSATRPLYAWQLTEIVLPQQHQQLEDWDKDHSLSAYQCLKVKMWLNHKEKHLSKDYSV